MANPAAKRRRLDQTNRTLCKPFRSPFKSPLKQVEPTALNALTQANTEMHTNLQLDIAGVVYTPPSTTPNSDRSSTKSKKLISPSSAAVLNSDPDIAALLSTQRDLQRQIREVKAELDTVEQARKIEESSRKKDVRGTGEIDADLQALVVKWRAASRQAAEEMFSRVRDRVNRMGGPRAFMEMQRRKDERQREWEMEGFEQPTGGARDDAQQQDLEAEYGNDLARQGGREEDVDAPDPEDEFTMAMMLKTLNIELSVIGYDKDEQRWID